jgi:hypothetical protein
MNLIELSVERTKTIGRKRIRFSLLKATSLKGGWLV